MPTTPARRFRPPKKQHPNHFAFDWILDAAPGSVGQRAVLRALETAPPEHIQLVGGAIANVASARIPPAAERDHPPTSDEMAKSLAILQDLDGGILWEPVRRAISALLRTPVPEKVAPDDFFQLRLYEAHAFLAAVATFVG